MDHTARFSTAAAARIGAWLGTGASAARGRVAESLVQPPGLADPAMAAAFDNLAREMARSIAEMPLEQADAAAVLRAVNQAVERGLAEHPQLMNVMRARLVGMAHKLGSLPPAASLAKRGLEASPGWLVGGRSPAFAELITNLETAAACELPVLLIGETGTGKELLARRLHRLSPRHAGPFQAFNCAALAETLLEAELFGSVKGAYTGSERATMGHVRAAHGGTLFLDELNESTPGLQKKLLRVLEDSTVVPVGGQAAIGVDFRLVAAVSEDLARAVERGAFNQALMYRVDVIQLRLPPLRERMEDLPVLVEHFLEQARAETGRARVIGPEAMDVMADHHWPGNVRQLRNAVRRAVAMSPGEVITPADLPEAVLEMGPGAASRRAGALSGVEGLSEAHRAEVARLLAQKAGQALYNRDLRDILGVSDSTAKKVLRSMVEAGLLQIQGDRGGRRYLVPESK